MLRRMESESFFINGASTGLRLCSTEHPQNSINARTVTPHTDNSIIYMCGAVLQMYKIFFPALSHGLGTPLDAAIFAAYQQPAPLSRG